MLVYNEKHMVRQARICFYAALKPLSGNFFQEVTWKTQKREREPW